MQHGDGGKGSGRRPGQGYQDGWDRIFSKPKEKSLAELVAEDVVRGADEALHRAVYDSALGRCTQCTYCAPASECRLGAGECTASHSPLGVGADAPARESKTRCTAPT